ncbi:alpha/beta-hydrolase [Clavulina sp. PMI_390]|nr:alpha/beta-hydrolase [Clavulina sp. PMI_390]
MLSSLFVTLGLFLLGDGVGVRALPTRHSYKRTLTDVSATEVTDLTPFGQFSRAAYCNVDLSFSCGDACNALPGFQVEAFGGDGDANPRFFVGFWPTQNTAVVVHEGTDPTKLFSVLNDVKVVQIPLNTTLFPGAPSNLEVHDGFADAHAFSAAPVLAAVKSIFAAHSISSVTVVGHSLGGAIATLDSVFLKMNLPASTTIKTVVHGCPRVGNQAFADFIDANFNDFTRITHQSDPIPVVPGRFLGFHHPSGEIHIEDNDSFVACSGQDNPDPQCSTGAVSNVLFSNILDHLGPYNGVSMGTVFC